MDLNKQNLKMFLKNLFQIHLNMRNDYITTYSVIYNLRFFFIFFYFFNFFFIVLLYYLFRILLGIFFFFFLRLYKSRERTIRIKFTWFDIYACKSEQLAIFFSFLLCKQIIEIMILTYINS
jgi:hypothetical protein